MKHMFINTIAAVTLLIGMMFAFPTNASAAETPTPAAVNNLPIGLSKSSWLVSTDSGYMRVYLADSKLMIEYYDNSFNITEKKSIDRELELFGGFYEGSDAYYVVEGRLNTDEIDTNEVFRVIKYSKDWKRLGAASITGNPSLFGGDVRRPFRKSCVEMTEYNGKLYIATAHEGYFDPDYNQGHQGFILITVDTNTMKGSITDCDLWHSFAQYIVNKGSDIFVLEQSEGSRCVTLAKVSEGGKRGKKVSLLDYGGNRTSAWAIACYASVDGIALSGSNILTVGTSIDQSQYDSLTSNTPHNIYLTVTPMSDISEDKTIFKWLTSHNDDGCSFAGLKLTKVNDNRFMVSWEEYGVSQEADFNDPLSGYILHYMFIDGSGNALSKEFTASAPISDCQPIVKGNDIVYYASSEIGVDFYKINSSTGAFSKKVYRSAGENVTWSVKDGVLTVSGTGEVCAKPDGTYRYPLSSVSSGYVFYGRNNAWDPIRDAVTKVVVEKGITSISEFAFASLPNLTEATVASGVTSVEKQAFYNCSALRKVYIPASVKAIGDDILWTGSYWVSDDSHVVYAEIIAPDGSYAIDYAKANKIRYTAEMGDTHYHSYGSYGTPTYTWSSDNKTCTAETRCSGCKDVKTEKVNSGSTTKAATCTAAGSTVYTAKFNNTAFTTQTKNVPISAKGHTSVSANNAKAATCTTAGKESDTKCSVCGVTLTTGKTINAKGHTSVSANNAKAATCTAAGKESDTKCSVCGVTLTTGKTINAKGHTYGAWTTTKAATCSAAGTQTRTCSSCSNKETKTVAATGKHTYTDKVVAPTTTAQGYTLHLCLVCGDSYKDNYKDKLPTATKVSAVTGLKLKGRANNALCIAWNKNTSADGYIVEMYKGGKWVRVAKIAKNTTTEWKQTKLAAGTAYKFRVKAYKMNGKTAVYSSYVNISARTNPSNVTGMKTLDRSRTAIRFGWTKNTSADGYIVEMYKDGKWVRAAKITSNATVQFKKTGLKANTTYKFRVRAYKMSGSTALYSGYTNFNISTTK